MWCKHHQFSEVVKQSWVVPIQGTVFHTFAAKLKRLRATLIAWNKGRFGNVFKKVENAEKLLSEAERRVEDDQSSQALECLHNAKIALNQALHYEEQFWRQRAKVKWLVEGDKSTKFFHAVATVKRKRSKIFGIKDMNGNWVSEQTEIAAAGVDFFKAQFSMEHQNFDFLLITELVPEMIIDAQKEAVIGVPGGDEIKEAVFSINADGAAGPDGFNGHFYRQCWDIIKEDLIVAVQSFFQGQIFPKSWSSTLIVAIPKVENPSSFGDMRPIILCNFNDKIISKIVAERMALILPVIISPE